MKKVVETSSRAKPILLTIAAVLIVLFIIVPLAFLFFDGSQFGNVALIPIDGVITGDGQSYLGSATVSSSTIVQFIQEAEDNPSVKAIVLEINSPGGSAVASDEIATSVKKSSKPVIALIREVGASGGYWIASATDHIVANKMSITGSIGVVSSYLEFSELMDEYGITYQRMVAGKYKDIGTPLKQLDDNERVLLQGKLDKIHTFFIQEIAANRNLPESKVRELATGEFYLGIEALDAGLVDQLGDKDTVEQYLQETYGLKEISYIHYQQQSGILQLLSGEFNDFSFHIGQGISSLLLQKENNIMLM